jgi:CRP-like cAMP-binding protein
VSSVYGRIHRAQFMQPDELTTIPFFSDLSDEERTRIAPRAERLAMPAGKRLVVQGERGYEFFVIEDGTAGVYCDNQHIRDLGRGDFFGEIALVTRGDRTATVVSRTPMRLVVVTRRGFAQLCEEVPDVAAHIRAAMRERMQVAFSLERSG